MKGILSDVKVWFCALALLLPLASAKSSMYTLAATAYTSSSRETDRTPHITATGATTRLGIVALSRDMLRHIPYGSIVKIQEVGSKNSAFNNFFKARQFIVEDTMHKRMERKIDIWMPDYSTAIRFGRRTLSVTVIRYGRG